MKTEDMKQFSQKAADYLTTLGEIRSDFYEMASRCESDGDSMTQMRFEAAAILLRKSQENIESILEEVDKKIGSEVA